MTYEEWKLKLIQLIINETRIKGDDLDGWRCGEISCVLNDDWTCEYNHDDSPEEVWQGEIDSIADSQ